MDRKRARYQEEVAAENLSNFEDLKLWMDG